MGIGRGGESTRGGSPKDEPIFVSYNTCGVSLTVNVGFGINGS